MEVVVLAAGALVKLYEFWKKAEPEVKRIVTPVIDGCKKISDIDLKTELKAIEEKEK